MIRLENKTLGHNKFYEIYHNGRIVNVRYGAIGTVGTSIKKRFGTETDARQWTWSTKYAKEADGYVVVPSNSQQYWQDRAKTAETRIAKIDGFIRGY